MVEGMQGRKTKLEMEKELNNLQACERNRF